jgi:hypothetical protein
VPSVPGAAENAAAVRTALVGNQLLDLSSDVNSSTKNLTRFCADNRADRSEEFNRPDGFVNSDLTGTWAVMTALRQADGTLVADIAFTADDSTFDQRVITITIGTDGTVRRPAAKASELQTGGSCSSAQPDGVTENDTAAARSQALQQLTGRRVEESAPSATADFCSSTRSVRRENGTLVLDGAWTVEWAVSSAQGVVATVTMKDAKASTSRRLAVAIAASGEAQVQDLATGADAKTATLGAAAC